MGTEEITLERVSGELTELVATVGPDYRDQRYLGSRVYVQPRGVDRPKMEAGCMMGRWLHQFHNVGLEWLHEREGQSVETLIDELTRQLSLLPPVQVKAMKYLTYCQDKQDADYTWGEVLERGRLYAEKFLALEDAA